VRGVPDLAMESRAADEAAIRDDGLRHDRGFWFFAAIPLVTVLVAAFKELLGPREPTP
jgi:hypothetical protein